MLSNHITALYQPATVDSAAAEILAAIFPDSKEPIVQWLPQFYTELLQKAPGFCLEALPHVVGAAKECLSRGLGLLPALDEGIVYSSEVYLIHLLQNIAPTADFSTSSQIFSFASQIFITALSMACVLAPSTAGRPGPDVGARVQWLLDTCSRVFGMVSSILVPPEVTLPAPVTGSSGPATEAASMMAAAVCGVLAHGRIASEPRSFQTALTELATNAVTVITSALASALAAEDHHLLSTLLSHQINLAMESAAVPEICCIATASIAQAAPSLSPLRPAEEEEEDPVLMAASDRAKQYLTQAMGSSTGWEAARALPSAARASLDEAYIALSGGAPPPWSAGIASGAKFQPKSEEQVSDLPPLARCGVLAASAAAAADAVRAASKVAAIHAGEASVRHSFPNAILAAVPSQDSDADIAQALARFAYRSLSAVAGLPDPRASVLCREAEEALNGVIHSLVANEVGAESDIRNILMDAWCVDASADHDSARPSKRVKLDASADSGAQVVDHFWRATAEDTAKELVPLLVSGAVAPLLPSSNQADALLLKHVKASLSKKRPTTETAPAIAFDAVLKSSWDVTMSAVAAAAAVEAAIGGNELAAASSIFRCLAAYDSVEDLDGQCAAVREAAERADYREHVPVFPLQSSLNAAIQASQKSISQRPALPSSETIARSQFRWGCVARVISHWCRESSDSCLASLKCFVAYLLHGLGDIPPAETDPDVSVLPPSVAFAPSSKRAVLHGHLVMHFPLILALLDTLASDPSVVSAPSNIPLSAAHTDIFNVPTWLPPWATTKDSYEEQLSPYDQFLRILLQEIGPEICTASLFWPPTVPFKPLASTPAARDAGAATSILYILLTSAPVVTPSFLAFLHRWVLRGTDGRSSLPVGVPVYLARAVADAAAMRPAITVPLVQLLITWTRLPFEAVADGAMRPLVAVLYRPVPNLVCARALTTSRYIAPVIHDVALAAPLTITDGNNDESVTAAEYVARVLRLYFGVVSREAFYLLPLIDAFKGYPAAIRDAAAASPQLEQVVRVLAKGQQSAVLCNLIHQLAMRHSAEESAEDTPMFVILITLLRHVSSSLEECLQREPNQTARSAVVVQLRNAFYSSFMASRTVAAASFMAPLAWALPAEDIKGELLLRLCFCAPALRSLAWARILGVVPQYPDSATPYENTVPVPMWVGPVKEADRVRPQTLLVMLHELDVRDKLGANAVHQGVATALGFSNIFKPSVCVAALRQIIDMNPLPIVLMKTIFGIIRAHGASIVPMLVSQILKPLVADPSRTPLYQLAVPGAAGGVGRVLWGGFVILLLDHIQETLALILILPSDRILEVLNTAFERERYDVIKLVWGRLHRGGASSIDRTVTDAVQALVQNVAKLESKG